MNSILIHLLRVRLAVLVGFVVVLGAFRGCTFFCWDVCGWELGGWFILIKLVTVFLTGICVDFLAVAAGGGCSAVSATGSGNWPGVDNWPIFSKLSFISSKVIFVKVSGTPKAIR